MKNVQHLCKKNIFLLFNLVKVFLFFSVNFCQIFGWDVEKAHMHLNRVHIHMHLNIHELKQLYQFAYNLKGNCQKNNKQNNNKKAKIGIRYNCVHVPHLIQDTLCKSDKTLAVKL